ncbi:MAG: GNAT family N-acetyltransferase [Victivallaceae bacterium]|nr:GNAT family N-acetyltransferase [Victivallaceae bacterium]
MKQLVSIREAVPSDVEAIHDLLCLYAKDRIVLPRSQEDITFYLGNFVVAEIDGKVIGCAAVRDFGNHLSEVRSLAVAPALKGKGIGRALIEAIIAGMRIKHPQFRLFALTLTPEFFRKLGFQIVSKELFPEKIWSDCAQCPKRECCDEAAVLFPFPSEEN